MAVPQSGIVSPNATWEISRFRNFYKVTHVARQMKYYPTKFKTYLFCTIGISCKIFVRDKSRCREDNVPGRMRAR
jgi:hypothetical protein